MQDDFTKTCTKCGESWPATEKYFHRGGKGPDGLQARCRACKVRGPDQEHRRAFMLAKMRAVDGEKVCSECLKTNPATAEFFYRNPCCEGGLTSRCKACLVPANASRYYADAESNRAKARAKQRKLRETNPKRVQERKRLYSERLRADPERYEQHRQVNKQYRFEAADRIRAWRHEAEARRRDAPGEFTNQDVTRMYDEQGGLCEYCGVELGGSYHVEHMTPLSRGGTNWPDNLCLSCALCNHRKRSKTAEEFREYIMS